MLDILIKNHVSPFLRQHGYKKKNMTWNRIVGDVIQVIDIQLASHSDIEEGVFTINLGLFHREVWKICWQKEAPRFVYEHDCFPRVRMSQLLDNPSRECLDDWWSCAQVSNIEVLANEILDAMENKCIPFVDRMLTLKNIANHYRDKATHLMPIDKIYFSIMLSLHGEKALAASLLSNVRSISKALDKRVNIVQSQLF